MISEQLNNLPDETPCKLIAFFPLGTLRLNEAAIEELLKQLEPFLGTKPIIKYKYHFDPLQDDKP